MTKNEERRLLALAKRFEREGESLWKKTHKNYDKAGHDGNGGTGDEGWTKCFKDFGRANALAECGSDLRAVIHKLKKSS
jgi:hypothetical protein